MLVMVMSAPTLVVMLGADSPDRRICERGIPC